MSADHSTTAIAPLSAAMWSILAVAAWVAISATPLAAQGGDISLSLLEAPPSPAFVLLGIEPASVERPGSVTDFGVSVLNATDQLSVLPENYAASIAPYWLFGWGRDDTFEEYRSKVDPGKTILRTLALSVALTPTSVTELTPDEDVTSLGLGVRFSLAEGSIADDANPELRSLVAGLDSLANGQIDSMVDLFPADTRWRALSEESQALQRRVAELVRTADLSDEQRQELETLRSDLARVQALQEARETQLLGDLSSVSERVQELARRVRLRRTGFKLDIAGGIVMDFADRATAKADITRGGFWATGGYEWDGFVALGVGRFLIADKELPNSLDLGGRLIFDGGDRFSLSFEGLWRRSFDVETTQYVPVGDPTATPIEISYGESEYRVAAALEYAIAQGQTVSFTFGRDFEGVTTQSGNLLAIVSFALGLGSDRLGPNVPVN